MTTIDLKSKSILIADNGLFAELAPRLARDFGQVKYFCPWGAAYPRAGPANIGVGLPGVTRVLHFWDHVPDVDCVVFPEGCFSDWQTVVAEKFGKPVWGHRKAERLEDDRLGTRRLQKDLGIGRPKTRYFMGVDSLADYLEKVTGKWVKLSTFRGDLETFHHCSWTATKVLLDQFRARVGPLAERFEFMVEDEAPGVEIGYDGWTVKGEFPKASWWGFEIKDRGYVGCFDQEKDQPEALCDVNAKMAPILRQEEAVGFCSFECRVDKGGTSRMIDPALRSRSPAGMGLLEGLDNLSEIIWEGANGRMVEPKASGQYLAIALIRCEHALTHWVPLGVSKSARTFVKLRNAAKLGGQLYHVPTGSGCPIIGAVVGISDSLEEATALVRDRAAIEGYGVHVELTALDEAKEIIQEAKEYGIDF